MTRDGVLYLDDMLDHARAAQRFVAGKTLDAFAQDTRSQYAVKYALQVIGEAARQVPDSIRERFSHVPWQQSLPCGTAWRTTTSGHAATLSSGQRVTSPQC